MLSDDEQLSLESNPSQSPIPKKRKISSPSTTKVPSSSSITTTKMSLSSSVTTTKKAKQRFRLDWLKDPLLMDWLQSVPDDIYRAKCKICCTLLTGDIGVLKKHAQNVDHLRKVSSVRSIDKSKITNFVVETKNGPMSEETKAVKQAEMIICEFFAEHNVPFLALNHLTDVLKNAFLDSKIAQAM